MSDRKKQIIEGQTYCLRWNNHKANLVEILDALIKRECYVDCTIYVDNQIQFKAHRVVLAANSPYFQSILQDVPNDHCTILLPGVQAFEMRCLLDYMYTGEVNVTQSQIERIMKIAEQLEVKGLFDLPDLQDKFDKFDEPHHGYSQPTGHYNTPPSNNGGGKTPHSPSHISTSSNVSSAQCSSSSPPYNYKSPFANIYSRSPIQSEQPQGLPSRTTASQWQSLASQIPTAAMLSSYEASADMNPLRRKKHYSALSTLMSRDTPILRNVLANAADSSQGVPLVCQPIPSASTSSSTGKESQRSGQVNGNEFGETKPSAKYEEPPHSPYTDKSYDDDAMETGHNYSGNDSRIASYVPQQKPEWKRYKQYTRSDILSAIECVRNGMSALQASRKFGVPSRTLYDKVKKLGISTGRPMNRTVKRSPSNSNGPAGFPYGISGTSSPFGHHHNRDDPQSHHERSERDTISEAMHSLPPNIPSAAALLDPAFLQAFGAGGDPLQAMALAAAAHATFNGLKTSPTAHGQTRSPPSPSLLKLMRSSNEENDKENNKHEDNEMADDEDMYEKREEPQRERGRDRDRDRKERKHSDEDQSERGEDDQVEDLSMSSKREYSEKDSHSRDEATPSPKPILNNGGATKQTGVIVTPASISSTKADLSPQQGDDYNGSNEMSVN